MSSTFKKVAAIAAASTLVISGASSANAQLSSNPDTNVDGTVQGQIDLGSLGTYNVGSSAQVDADGNPIPQPSSLGNLGTGSDNGTANAGSLSGLGTSDSLKAYGLSPDSGSLLQPVDATGNGSLDTANTSLGEPTSGSLKNMLSTFEGSVNFSNPAPGTGSVDTSGSALLREPTTGSLAGLWAPVAGSLGINQGITTVLGSTEGGSLGSLTGSLPAGSLGSLTGSLPAGSLGSLTGSLPAGAGSLAAALPLVLVGGSIAAGIAAAPMIQQALAGMNIALPGMPVIAMPAIPGLPALPGSSMPAPAPAKPAPAPAAPGPIVDNGRG